MEPQLILPRAEEAMSPRRVFGDPVQVDGVPVLPVATVGGGFGLGVQPAGVFVIRDGDAKWRPALNVNRVILGGQIVGLAAILTFGSLLRSWMKNRVAVQSA